MACDAARAGADSVPPRRVAAVRRLLVLGGLLIAGWLLGCAADSAHADELPAASAHVVARTPVLGHAVETATERPPVRRVVRALKPLREVSPAEAPKPSEAVQKASAPEAPVSDAAPTPNVHRQLRISKVAARAASAVDGHAEAHRVVRQVPVQAPERPDDHSAAGALAMTSVAAGLPDVATWAPAPPQASVPRVSGTVPPAVRTAADEPSIAPD